MPAQRDRTHPPGGETAAVLARRLGDAVRAGANGNGNGYGHRNGNGKIETPSPREIAIDVCSAILAEASAGTAEHSSDVVLITEAIGERMGITGAEAQDLLAAARLHDIGKAWVPRRILEKPGPLTDEEWELMYQHTLVGQQILSPVAELEEVGRIVRHSHERWDGRGYPDGLAGSEIPLGSRIVFCADTFHAVRCDRPYRAGRSADEAVAEIKRCAGTQFDPAVAEALEEVVRERRRRPRGARASRLFALLMCLVVGGAGTALARSDLLGEPAGASSSSPAPHAPPACGTAACPSVAGPVGGLAQVGGPGWLTGPRVLHPGLPGRLHGGVAGGNDRPATGVGNHGKKDRGNHGKSDQAKQNHAAKGRGKALGHSHSSGKSGSSQSEGASSPSSSSHTRGSAKGESSGSSHGQVGGSGGSGTSSGGSGSNGNSGNSGNSANGGNSANAGGSSGSHAH